MTGARQSENLALGPGQTVAGKYRLVRELGVGGMCIVYEAEHLLLHQSVALKILKPELAGDPDCVARFEREARAAAQLRGHNVARVFDVDWLPEGQPYITMELLVGRDIGSELSKRGRVPSASAVDYVRQAASGIAEAHALGIVHRDLKPENLFLVDLGALTDRSLVKILDFGIAKTLSDEARRLTAPDAVFGTVDYMSPEQIRSASTVDHRTDIWSLGVILYELVTGRTPYAGDARAVIAQIVSEPIKPPTAFVPELPPSLAAVIMKALQKDPDKRFQSAEELSDALVPLTEFEPITQVLAALPPQSVPRRRNATTQPPPSGPQREMRTHASWETAPARRPRSRAWIGVMLAIACMVGGGAFYARTRTARRFALPTFAAARVSPALAPPVASPSTIAATTPSMTVSAPVLPIPAPSIAALPQSSAASAAAPAATLASSAPPGPSSASAAPSSSPTAPSTTPSAIHTVHPPRHPTPPRPASAPPPANETPWIPSRL